MSAIMVSGDRPWSLDVHQDSIDISGPVPDPKWVWYDGKGHRHYAKKGKTKLLYPTLVKKRKTITVEPEGEYCDSCGCYYEDYFEPYESTVTWYECKKCGEEVVPGWVEQEEKLAGLKTTTGEVWLTFEEAEKLAPKVFEPGYFLRLGDWLIDKKRKLRVSGKAVVTEINPSIREGQGKYPVKVYFQTLAAVSWVSI